MKKYIIVSIIVAALFVGGSIAVVKAQQAAKAQTMTIKNFASGMSAYLIKVRGSTIAPTVLSKTIEEAVKNIGNATPVLGGTGGLAFTKVTCTSIITGDVSCCDVDSAGFMTNCTPNACI